MMRVWKRGGGLVVVALLVLAPTAAWAQSSVSTGQILGSIKDPDGAAMPGVGIEARNPDTGFARNAVTDVTGFYRIELLPSGSYDVRADLPGFKSEVKRGVVVTLGSSVALDFALQVSAVEEEIVVTAESPIVETTNPSMSSAVSDESIANLPLEGRDFTNFVSAPGRPTATTRWRRSRRPQHWRRGIKNSFNIDGSTRSRAFSARRGGTRPPFTFSQSAIKEFRSCARRTTCSSRRRAASSTPSQSGTNEFHGRSSATTQRQLSGTTRCSR
jgi:hypothetical protein